MGMGDTDAGLVTFGETMALLVSDTATPLRHATSFRMSTGGSESNVAIGVRRMGHKAGWMGRVGRDELGAMVLGHLRAEQVDVSKATIDEELATGLMLRSRRSADIAQVVYYRRGSAGSAISTELLDEDAIRQAGVLFVTGITMALSRSASDAVLSSIAVAREARALVCFDPNFRDALWSRADAAKAYREVIGSCDILLCGEDEATLITDAPDPVHAARTLSEMGPSQVIVRCGGEKVVGMVEGSQVEWLGQSTTVVDRVGAGDAFAAGYLAGILSGSTVEQRLDAASRCAGVAVSTDGDWEGLPTLDELGSLGPGGEHVVR